MNIKDIAKQIKRSDNERKPVLIGVEGFGGSGKTTLANQLKEALGSAHVVTIDDFIVKEKLTEPSWEKVVLTANDWRNKSLYQLGTSNLLNIKH